jgi:TonB family protein
METVVQTPTEAELHLLTDWGEVGAAQRRRRAVAGTLLFHVALIGVLMAVPASVFVPREEPRHEVPPLIMPLAPTPLTQKAPNRGKVMTEFQVQPSAPRPKVQTPQAPPAVRQNPRPAVIPQGGPTPPKAGVPALPEAPQMASAKPLMKNDVPALSQIPAPPPQIQAEEKPKLVLENAGGRPQPSAPTGRVPMPRTSVTEAMQDLTRARGAGGRQAAGDPGAFDNNPYSGLNSPPAPGMQGAGVELKSDAEGVDFRAYLTQILAIVRGNWFAVMPESVHLGLRGKTALQLAISRDGTVAHLVYAEKSGSHALDEAAVAGVSASNPLPPLPPEFKGDRIVVQFNFVYNMPKR